MNVNHILIKVTEQCGLTDYFIIKSRVLFIFWITRDFYDMRLGIIFKKFYDYDRAFKVFENLDNKKIYTVINTKK